MLVSFIFIVGKELIMRELFIYSFIYSILSFFVNSEEVIVAEVSVLADDTSVVCLGIYCFIKFSPEIKMSF